MPNSLEGREIFAVGTWNNISFTEEDLDDIVANFEKLAETHKVPLKFGHNEEQPITDGQPAIGWVSKVYRQGKKLLADFSDVPSVVLDAIKRKLYRSVSVELLFNVDNKGNKFDHVLDAVAILGADQPAVNSLSDLNMLLATRTEFSGGRRVVFNVSKGIRYSDKITPEFDMDKRDIEQMISAAVEPLKEANVKLTEENDSLRAKLEAKEAQDRDREKQQRLEKIEATRNSIKELIDKAVTENKMTPAVREVYTEQIGLYDDNRVLDIDVEKVKVMCSISQGADTKPMAKDTADDIDDGDAQERLLTMTRKFQQEHNEPFRVAFMRVCESNPDLHREYLDSNGEK